jgi:hypothetical protein
MPRGIAIVIGVRAAPVFSRYGLPVLESAEADAYKMTLIAQGLGYEVQGLLGPDATVQAVEQAVQSAAAALTGTGDTFLLSFSGHGVKLEGGVCEGDGDDEHWCLYDGLIVDDLIRSLLKSFPSQARVYIVADCCYSGEIGEWIQLAALVKRRLAEDSARVFAEKLLIPEHIVTMYADVERERQRVRQADPTLDCTPPSATVLLLASVRQGLAVDGAFMRGLRKAWGATGARKSFTDFCARIEIEVFSEIKQPPVLIPSNSPLAVQPPFAF